MRKLLSGFATFTPLWQGTPMFWIKFVLIAAMLLIVLLLDLLI